jgi:glycosyltransferase involved in cell wall biosynthesis|tara:strand:- start:735 stop:1991 length:1257 start_codon:yes stop_codon:yes gene_type:complete
MRKVLLEGPILTRSGYGEHARLVFKALSQSDNVEIFVNPLKWGATSWAHPNKDIFKAIKKFANYNNVHAQAKQQAPYDMHIHVGIPNEFTKKAPFSICVTAGIETDRVSSNWLIKTHQGIDKLIVPSEHAKDGFVSTNYEVINETNNTKTILNCNCPVDVVPYPVKSPAGPGLDIDFSTDFNFLSVALMGHRKNIEMTLEGFVEQFRDNPNVGLILKTAVAKSSHMDRLITKKKLEDHIESLGEKKCKIYLLHGNLTEAELHSLYVHPKVKAYVTTTHGEGYGLPLFEAAYSGLPIIATDWSGHLDFLSGPKNGKNKKMFARVDYDLKPVQKEALWKDLIMEDSRWAFPKMLSYKAQLEKVYKNLGMYKKWSKVLKEKLEKDFSEEVVLAKMSEALTLKQEEETNNEIDDMFASLAGG